MFIVFEGLDGAGKTTLRDAIGAALTSQGHEVVLTREPGGTPFAEHLRELCKYGSEKYDERLTEQTRLCLLAASRSQHLEHVIKPKLAAGAIVLSDRFFWSTLAYTDSETYESAWVLHRALGNDLEPDLIIYLDVDQATSQARRQGEVSQRDRPDDIETKLDTRFAEARLVYTGLALREPNVVTLDARLPPSTLFAKAMEAISAVQARLNENESQRATPGEADHAGRGGNPAQ